MPWVPPLTYRTLWGANLPTSGPSSLANGTVGNIIRFDTIGRVIGFRWAQGSTSGNGQNIVFGMATLSQLQIELLAWPRIPWTIPAAGVVKWNHVYVRRGFLVSANSNHIVFARGISTTIHYKNAAQLVGAEYVGSRVRAPANGSNALTFNGRVSANQIVPNATAGGDLFGLDVLFLPDDEH